MALLRGINVGGKSRVDMKTLKATVEEVGCADVRTYINSGNVIFRDRRKPRSLIRATETAIEAAFGFAVPVLLRDLETMQRLCDAIPAEWGNGGEDKTDVLFLQDDVDNAGLLDAISYRPEIEDVLHVHGALVWHIARKDATRSSLQKLVGGDLYKRMSIRNINTTRKLRDLMAAAADR